MLGGSIAAPFLPVSQSMALAAKLHATHECLAISMVVLLAIHLGAVAKHHLIYRDQLLRRMSFSSD
jgi:cytochrome b561